MRNHLRTAALVATLALSSQPAAAQGVPVGDGLTQGNTFAMVGQGFQMLGLSTQELAEIQAILSTAQTHLQTAQDMYASMTGVRGDIAGLFETIVEYARIAENLEGLNTGTGVSDEVKERIAAIDATFKFETGEEFFGADDATGRGEVMDIMLNSVRSSMVVSETNFEASATAFTRYEGYRNALGSGSTDLKSAIDLNTRVAIENGENMARMIQLLSTFTEMDAVHRAANARAQQQNRAKLRMKTE